MKTLFILCCILSLSCSKSTNPDKLTPEQIFVDAIHMDNYDQILSAKNDKAVLINLWATWCKPCIEEFPEIMKLQSKYKDQLDVIFISLDDQERMSEVKDFLIKVDYGKKSYIKTGPDEVLFKFMPDDFSGAIPYTIIKNKSNKIVSKLMGKQTYETFETHIKKALN